MAWEQPAHPTITLFSSCSLDLLTECSACLSAQIISSLLCPASAGVSQVPATHSKFLAKASGLDLGSDLSEQQISGSSIWDERLLQLSAEGLGLLMQDILGLWMDALFLRRRLCFVFVSSAVRRQSLSVSIFPEMVKPHQPATTPASARGLRQNCEALRKELKPPFRLVWCPECT